MMLRGYVTAARGGLVQAYLPGRSLGEHVRIGARGEAIGGRIVALDGASVTVAAHGDVRGIAAGYPVFAGARAGRVPIGTALFGRAVNARGEAIDRAGLLRAPSRAARIAPPALAERVPLHEPFWCGVRAVDGLLTFARGARAGIFGAPGAGKSSLLQAVVRNADADGVVLALIGERGREAEEWLRSRPAAATIFCATSDRSAAERVRCAELAMAQAVRLRSLGLHVLLILDSFARYAAALREIAIAAGEAVGRAGYPPSVFAAMAQYAEAAGASQSGSVTLLASVLSDGDERDPVSDAARSLLDGHIELSSRLAGAGRYPAIDVLRSQSRTMDGVAGAQHRRDAAKVRAALAALDRTADAREAGILCEDPQVLRALEAEPALEEFLRFGGPSAPQETLSALARLADTLE